MLRQVMIVTALAALLAFPASASQDATPYWNSVCAQYGFPEAPVGGGLTFADVWPAPGYMPSMGQDCESALMQCCMDVARIMHSPIPPFDGDDTYDASIQNWP